MLTCFISPECAGAAARLGADSAGSAKPGERSASIGAAQLPQNLFSGGFAAPQDGHATPNGAAHCPQNRMPAGFSA
jgi:hypothetical protein